MAYTICDSYGMPKPIRLLLTNAADVPYAGQPFTPYWWTCDPCNPASMRYEIEHQAGQSKPTGYRWFEVITSDDTDADVALKIAHYAKVIAANKALDAARIEYERLNGR